MKNRELEEVGQRIKSIHESDIAVVLSDCVVREIRRGNEAEQIGIASEKVYEAFDLMGDAIFIIKQHLKQQAGSEEWVK